MIIKDFIQQHPSIEVKVNEDLTSYSTMRLRARGDVIIVKSIAEAEATVKFFDGKKILRPIGLGSNQLFPEQSLTPYVKIEFPIVSDMFSSVKNHYDLPANTSLQMLTKHAMQFALKGWEVFTGIPGNIGGSVFMNAGTELGEIGDLVISVKVLQKNGTIRDLVVTKKEDFFSYRKNHFCQRGDLILQVGLKHFGIDQSIPDQIKNYLKKRATTQPLKSNTCGCVFKNPSKTCRAGQTLDIMGMKGFVYKHFRISPVHANFIENLGDGTYTEFLEFIEIIQEKVEKEIGQRFELEVEC